MLARLVFSLLFTFNFVYGQTTEYLLVGAYTKEKAEGIYVYKFDPVTGDNSFVSSYKTPNASYLAVSPDQKKVYAVNERSDTTAYGVGGSVSAFSFNNKSGSLEAINQQFSFGKDPCYISIDQSGKWAIVANYSSGTSALFPIKKDGSLDSVKQVIRDTGTGVDKDRQEGPHAHSTILSPDNKYLFIQDLGVDKILIYQFDKIKGKLTPATPPFNRSVAGSGPRHIDFHPNNKYVYLVEEMTGTVVAFKYMAGKLTRIQRITALPADFKGSIGSADIHVSKDGKFLYASNRGESNTIAIFKINQQTGKLSSIGYQSTLGKTPRNFNFDPAGNFLLVANQDTDDIIIFKVDKNTGLLTDTGKRINVSSPVCIKWIR